MAELTPNVDVPAMEEMVATMAGMAYGQYLRNLVVEKSMTRIISGMTEFLR